MKNPIVLILGILILINLFEQIYLFWKQRLRATFQKHYFVAKRDVAARNQDHFTSKSNSAGVQKHFSVPNSVCAGVHKHFSVSKSNCADVQKHFSVPKSNCAGVHKHFSIPNRVCAGVQKHFSVPIRVCVASKVLIIRVCRRVYAQLQIYYSTSRSLSIALFTTIIAFRRSPPFLHRNFPLIMRYIDNRKQHVSC